MVRAKFKVYQISSFTSYQNNEKGEGRTIKLSPVGASDDPIEGKIFGEASPMGDISIGIIPEEAWKVFELGKMYYVDFTKAE